ncbi:TolC family protein [Dyadobacter sp. NIV53]|uniref:TolC family protein n=1 Tax=Dyadobacter sp. NIV53 TaxID=2861765 RepID=UPI001C86F3DD|nr:TolC family protein [Dyadobacter sp. NIV53]
MRYLNRKILAICLLMVISVTKSVSQQRTTLDSGRIFTLKDLEELVFFNHPIVKQAGLLSEEAKAKVVTAWGEFDPALKSNFSRKIFGGSEYYNKWSNELKVPLWLAGADLKIGYDRNVGTYTNPETQTGVPGLTGLGLNIPIGQGLLVDSRRNTLRQSRVMVDYAEAQKIQQINKVWFDAVKDYWNWFYAYRQYELIREGTDLAITRYQAIRNQTLMGDKPAIDSIEAAITVQERSLQLEKMTMELANTRLVLSNHLWSEKADPLELPLEAVPQPADQLPVRIVKTQIDTLVSSGLNDHPQLSMLKYKGMQLEWERRYRKEMLKPKLNISGSLLTSRNGFNGRVPDNYELQWSNYKVGVDFSFPLFLREQRGKLREVQVKQWSLKYDVQQTGREIRTNIMSAYNVLKAYEAQLTLQARSIDNQQLLVSGELAKFDLGESTLFLINSRETKLIDMRIKMAEIISGYQKTIAEIYYAAGTSQSGMNRGNL